MGSQSSSSGWFKQAEQLETERKSGTVPPPVQRVPPRPPPPRKPTPTTPATLSEAAPPPSPEVPTTAEFPPAEPPPLAPAAPSAGPRPTPRVSAGAVTIPDLPDPGTPKVFRSPFHKPPATYRRPETVTPRPASTLTAAPASGRFSLVPDGPGHRIVYARPGDAGGLAPVVVGRLTVAELRQLRAALDRYLGAVDPATPIPAAATPGS